MKRKGRSPQPAASRRTQHSPMQRTVVIVVILAFVLFLVATTVATLG
jgi:hypothetical protein